MATAEHTTFSHNVIRFPEPGGTNIHPDGTGVGLEVYIAGIFAGLICVRGDAVLAYRNDFGPLGTFPTIDAGARAVAASLAN